MNAPGIRSQLGVISSFGFAALANWTFPRYVLITTPAAPASMGQPSRPSSSLHACLRES